jgi:hypothetical protein
VDAFVRILGATKVADVSGLVQSVPPAPGEIGPASAQGAEAVPAATPEDAEPPEAESPPAARRSRAA